jgi:hypothetical protein
MNTKICSNSNCNSKGVLQDLSNFYKKRKLKDGSQQYESHCKFCKKIYYKTRDTKTSYIKHRSKRLEYAKQNRTRKCERHKLRYKNDIQYKLGERIRSLIYRCFNDINSKKEIKSIDILGYSSKDLKNHLESLFLDGMTWDNYGLYGWHIDHIKPISTFVFTTEDDGINYIEMKKCNSLSNLQPLWAKDNLSKHNKFERANHESLIT